jgi:photosystem II stability/assembly factor-like uncharacterized protein
VAAAHITPVLATHITPVLATALACMMLIESAMIVLGVTPVDSILAIPVSPNIFPVMSAYSIREVTRSGNYPASVISWRHEPTPSTIKIVIIIDKNHIKRSANSNIETERRRVDKLRRFIHYHFRLLFNGWRNNNRRRWRSYNDSWWARDIDVDIDPGIHRGSDTQKECDDC